MNVPDQLFVIPLWQIRSANAAAEKHIPGEQKFLLRMIENQTSRRMTGHMDRLHAGVSKTHRLPLADPPIRWIHRIERHTKHLSLRHRVSDHKRIVTVREKRDPVSGPAKSDPQDVVEMTVGVDKFYRAKSGAIDETDKLFLFIVKIAAGINQDTFTGFIR